MDNGGDAGKKIMSQCDVEALKKCLEENKGDSAKCQSHIQAFQASCSIKRPNTSSDTSSNVSREYHQVNTDTVGLASIQIPELRIPCPPEPISQRFVYNIESSSRHTSYEQLLASWTRSTLTASGEIVEVSLSRPDTPHIAHSESNFSQQVWRDAYIDRVDYANQLQQTLLEKEATNRQLRQEIDKLRGQSSRDQQQWDDKIPLQLQWHRQQVSDWDAGYTNLRDT